MPSRVLFYHPLPEEVDHWEFQTSFDFEEWSWVETQPFVEDCSGCYEATISDSRDYPYYRARSVSVDGDFSDWSNVATLPELDICSALFVGVIVLSFISKKNKKHFA